jgi:integrase/recombinase XerD
MIEFQSILKEEFQSFLTIRKACLSESAFMHDKHYLTSFDAFLLEHHLCEKAISEDILVGWVKTLTGKASSRANEVIVIRIFIQYLHSFGIPAYTPVIPKVPDDYIPHIFSEDELHRIFDVADNIIVTKAQPNPYMRIEFPVILRLLYGCGLRIGETLALQMKDVDLDGGILTILHAKNNRQRFVPMSISLTEILRRYCPVMGIVGKPDAYLFPGTDPSEPMSIRSARNKFNVILKNTGIAPETMGWHERGPCLHCFRHLFVFRSFTQAELSGWAIDDSVPFLSTYLGHDSLNETDKYFKFSSELYPKALELFGCYAGSVFPEVDHEKESF